MKYIHQYQDVKILIMYFLIIQIKFLKSTNTNKQCKLTLNVNKLKEANIKMVKFIK